MRRKRIYICAVGAFVLSLVGALCFKTTAPEKPLPSQTVTEQKAESVSSAGEADEEAPEGGGYYILKDYEGRLAVYRVYGDGTQVLANLIDMDIHVLPAQDVENLRKGIVLRSEEALVRILEDFMS